MAPDSKDPDDTQPSAPEVPPQAVTSTQSDDDLVGTIYLGKYELDSVLGTGGMGVIYRGRQIFLDRTVAIKMLKSDMAGDKVRLRFHQEAKAASQLSHPGIVAINDFGVDDLDRPYMVMEYVEGCTLSELLRERRTLSVKDSLPIFLEICDALSAAHLKGIVHRDLKPSNIMLVAAADGKVHTKLLDFGIARILDIQEQTLQSLTRPGEALGTPLYMSPEQITGKKITHHSDLYSLGCLMYSSLTGSPPFVADSKMATLEKHCLEPPRPFKKVITTIDFPPGIEPIVMKLLEKRPENRYENVDRLKDALIEMAAQNGYMRRPESLPTDAGQMYLTGAIPEMPRSIADLVPKNPPSQAFDALFEVTRDDKAASSSSPSSSASSSSSPSSPSSSSVAPPTSSSSASAEPVFSDSFTTTSGSVPDFSSAQASTGPHPMLKIDPDELTPVKGVFRKGSQYDTSDMTRRLPPREREHAPPPAPLSVDDGPEQEEYPDEDSSLRDASSINKTFAIVGAVVAVVIVLLVGVTAISIGMQPHKPQPTHVAGDLDDTNSGAQKSDTSGTVKVSPADAIIAERVTAGAQDSTLSLRDQLGLSAKGLKQLAQFKLLNTLDLYGSHIDDAGVRLLSDCRLTKLNLDANFAITDFSLFTLSKMPTLRVLSLSNTGVSDKGLKRLANLPKLDSLYLNGNHQITDKGILNLAPSTSHLTVLSLYSCDISDDSAPTFLQFKDLIVLDLSRNPKVTNKTLKILKDKVKGLTTLAIGQDTVDEDGISVLPQYKDLKILDLSGIQISPKAQSYLATMKNLSCLYLEDCHLSTSDIQKLGSALPGVRIETNLGLESESLLERH